MPGNAGGWLGPRTGHVHVLLTKYNTRFGAGIQHKGLSADWLDYRLGLFRTTLMSVQAQTRRPDAWLIFIDSETPAQQHEALAETLGEAGELVLIEGPLTDARVAVEVRARLNSNVQRLATSRLDSDDAISASYIERIQRCIDGRDGFINARRGYQLVGRRLLQRWDRSSPFLTLVETVTPSVQVRTVFSVEHHLAGKAQSTRQLTDACWLQIIHDGNLLNVAEGFPAFRRVAQRELSWRIPVGQTGVYGSTVAMLASSAMRQLARSLRSQLD